MSSEKPRHSIGERVLTGSLWVGLWRWTARLMGLVTIIILARLLLPRDFGIVAAGLLVVSFFDIMIELGTENYLIRLKEPTRADYDTAWTLRLMVIAGASLTILVTAGPLADFFGDERLVDVLRVLACASALRGFANIGLAQYLRDLEYDKIATIGLGQRLLASATTIMLALVLQNYWAMVAGEVMFRVAELALSYRMHPYRPRLTLARVAGQWDFCKWIIARNLAMFLQGRGDQLIVTKFFGIEQIGLYSMAARFAAFPTTELMAPTHNPIYSGLAKQHADPAQFQRGLLLVIGAMSALVLPPATLFATLGESLITVILGPRWVTAAPLVAPLVAAAAFAVLAKPASSALTLGGQVKLLAVLQWAAGLLMIGAMLVAGYLGTLQHVASTRAALSLLLLLVYYHLVHIALRLPWLRLAAAVYRPVAATVILGCFTVWLAGTDLRATTKILSALFCGGILNVAVLYVLWLAASSPDGGEVLLVRTCAPLLRRVARRVRRRGRG